MGKSKQNKHQSNSNTKRAERPTGTSASPKEMEIREMQNDSRQLLTLGSDSPQPAPPRSEEVHLDQMWDMAHEAKERYEAATAELRQEHADLERRSDELQNRTDDLLNRENQLLQHQEQLQAAEKQLEIDRSKLSAQRNQIEQLRSEAAQQERKLLDLKANLRQQEINAEAGFVEQKKQMLVDFEQSIVGLKQERIITEKQIADAKTAWFEEQRKQQAALDQRLQKQTADIQVEIDRLERRNKEREAQLQKREIMIVDRENNAEIGFVNERNQMLEELKTTTQQLRKTLLDTETEIAGRRAEWHKEELAARDQLQADINAAWERFRAETVAWKEEITTKLTERETALQQQQDTLSKQQSKVAATERKLKWKAEELGEYETHLGERADTLAAAKVENLQFQLDSLQKQFEQARSDRDVSEQTLQKRLEADRKFGQRTPDEVLVELEQLRTQNDGLKTTLAQRPDADASARLQQLVTEQEQWRSDRHGLTQEAAQLRRQLAAAESDRTERESQRDHLESLKKRNELLAARNEELRNEIDGLIAKAGAKLVFPACSNMDSDSRLQNPGPWHNELGNLKEFVEDLQKRLVRDETKPLSYDQADLRAFVGGMAMSPLLLLQGISGTGKTSLPVAFAKAMGSDATIVEVQAGWRDPQDLIGHYDVFGKRFYEKEFLKALYRAQTPDGEDRIHIIVLDEMNLSHPEQYFSDLLSALEMTEDKRRLVLMTASVPDAPKLFLDGSKLRIPGNVWFVGTANHDETTKDFADKTYDRSHVMELPHTPPTPDNHKYKPKERSPISFAAFRDMLAQAQTDAKNAEKTKLFLDNHLRKPLGELFRIGWGPRFERQIQKYVPVVVSAGGTLAEATDHLIATRLFRKLRNRFDNRPEHIKTLKDTLQSKWKTLDVKAEPTKSFRILESELDRIGGA